MKYAVYGTLRLNQGNWNRLLKGNSNYISTEQISGYDMYHLGGFPGVKEGSGTIEVDIFDVKNPKVEENIDMLEGYNRELDDGMYLKKKIKINEEDCFIYTYNGSVDSNKLIKSGNWK